MAETKIKQQALEIKSYRLDLRNGAIPYAETATSIGYATPTFSTQGDECFLHGLVRNCPSGSAMFKLPSGITPEGNVISVVNYNGTIQRLDVKPAADGAYMLSLGTGWHALDSVRFKIARNIFSNKTNVAQGKAVTGSSVISNGSRITDGDASNRESYASIDTGVLCYVQIDLGQIYDLDMIRVFHYYDGRTYYDTRTQISLDGINWVDVFNSATQGTYAETNNGHILPMIGKCRYIRDYLRGSTANTGSHWVEIQAFI